MTFCSLSGEEGLRSFVIAQWLNLRQERLILTIGDLSSCDQTLDIVSARGLEQGG